MKKLLLILICLFVSSEVKSDEKNALYYMSDDDISVSKCVKYFEEGKVLHSWVSRNVYSTASKDTLMKKIVFAHKGKTYQLIVKTEKDKGNPDTSSMFMGENLESISCYLYDFDKE